MSDAVNTNSNEQTGEQLLPCPKCLDTLALTKWKDAEVSCGRCGFNAPFDVWQSRGVGAVPADEDLVRRADVVQMLDVCTCGSGPGFRPVGMRYHAATCQTHLATFARALPAATTSTPAAQPETEKCEKCGAKRRLGKSVCGWCAAVESTAPAETCQFNKGHNGPCTWLRPVGSDVDTSRWCEKPIAKSVERLPAAASEGEQE